MMNTDRSSRRKRKHSELESTESQSDEKCTENREGQTQVIRKETTHKKRKIATVDRASQKIEALTLDELSEPEEEEREDDCDVQSNDTGKDNENETTSDMNCCSVKWSDDRSQWSSLLDELNQAYQMKFDSSVIEFARFLHSLNENDPCSALLDSMGILCVGPLQWLCGMIDSFSFEELSAHWRFRYDLPEMMTCLVRISDHSDHVLLVSSQSTNSSSSSNDSPCVSSFSSLSSSLSSDHWCLWRDTPEDPPSAVVFSNDTHIKLECVGLTLFDALLNEITHQMELMRDDHHDFDDAQIIRLHDSLLKYCKSEKNQIELDENGSFVKKMMDNRKKQQCSVACHGFGLMVPLRKIEAFDEPVGWRPLNHSYRKMQSIMMRMFKEKKKKKRDGRVESKELDDEMRYVTMANDEADFGMGLELAYCFYLSRNTEGMFRKHSANLFRNAYSLIPGRKAFWDCHHSYLKIYQKYSEKNQDLSVESDQKTLLKIIV